MTRPPPWPAFDGTSDWLGTRLTTRRGIWGKVPGAASDYRWIARSRDFSQGRDDLALALRIGVENLPIRASLWRRLEDRHLAASVYPSRAKDSAGRAALIEKQVVELLSPVPVPACAAGLLLLPEIASHNDTDWWGRHDGEPWHILDHSLAIADAECPAPRLDPAALDAAITIGLGAIAERMPAGALHAFYVELLCGAPLPAHLAAPDPLPPAAIAALLLPLPRAWAERLSIAGGVAERRFQRADLGDNWDAVATGHRPDDPSARCDDEPQIEDLAGAIAEALASGAPARLPDLYRQRESWGLPAPVAETSAEEAPSPELVIDGIEPPPAESLPLIHVLHGFARTIDRRLLDIDAIARALHDDGVPADPQDRQARLLCAWPAALEAARPDWVEAEQWVLKCDQLRAAAWCLFPAPERTLVPGLPRQADVPVLLLAVLCGDARVAANLAALGADAFAAALDQGMRCPDRALRQRVATWAETWCQTPSAPSWAAEVWARRQASVSPTDPGEPATPD